MASSGITLDPWHRHRYSQDAHLRPAYIRDTSDAGSDNDSISDIRDQKSSHDFEPKQAIYGAETASSEASFARDKENQASQSFLHAESKGSRPSSIFSELAWWLPELACSILSIILFLCLIIVLRIYEGRAATDLQLTGGLTLNGLVALIATLNRACLIAPVCSAIMQEMWIYFASEAQKKVCTSRLRDVSLFADASLSAWGSLVFLLHARGSRLVACIGCLITVLSITYSTFAQQLLGIELVPDSSYSVAANLPRSDTWAQWGGTEFDAVSSFDPGLDMISALYNGVLANDVAPVQATCHTGNCTWPLTPSMGVCGGCASSSYSRIDCANGVCNYSFPSGSVASLYDFDNPSRNKSEDLAGFQVVPGRGAAFNMSLDNRLYIMNVDLFGASYWSFANPHPPLANTECALWMCIQTYKTTINSTIQHQEILSTYDNVNIGYHNLNVSGIPFDGGSYYDFPELPSETPSDKNNGFSVNLWAYLALQQYIHKSMQGSVYWNASQHFSNDLIRGIWNGTTNPHTWINNVALSMSNVVRSTNTSSRPEYNGTALALTIRIRWEWLTIPAILVVTSIVFLTMVVTQTMYSPVQSWKGSPLTLLLFDVDQDTRKLAYGHLEEHKGALKAVGDQRVQLLEVEGGIRRFQAF